MDLCTVTSCEPSVMFRPAAPILRNPTLSKNTRCNNRQGSATVSQLCVVDRQLLAVGCCVRARAGEREGEREGAREPERESAALIHLRPSDRYMSRGRRGARRAALSTRQARGQRELRGPGQGKL